MFRRRKPAPKPQPAPAPRAAYVKIMAQVHDTWSFQIEAPADEAYVCLADWIRIIHQPGDDEPAKTRKVGFSQTPPEDLGETRADTYRTDHDD